MTTYITEDYERLKKLLQTPKYSACTLNPVYDEMFLHPIHRFDGEDMVVSMMHNIIRLEKELAELKEKIK